MNKKNMNANKGVVSNNYHQSSSYEDDVINMELQMEKWMTEVEINLISLRPFTSVDDEATQLAQLRKLNTEIREKGGSIEMLSGRLSNKSSMKMIALHHGNVEELKERYDLVSTSKS